MIKKDVLIIGAGPTGLFCAHQLGIIGLSCEIVDNLDKAGGQCIELYPDKPIYDIPALPECTGEELTTNLLQQIKPFNVKFHLNERVEELKKVETRWHVKTSGKQEFDVASIVIAGGVGSFEPRKFPLKECEKFEGSSIFYSIKDKTVFKDKTISIFGGGDSALDWAIELSKFADVTLVHRRNEFRGAPHSSEMARNLEKEGKLKIKTPYQITSIKGEDKIEAIVVKSEDGKEEDIATDCILGFFGLIMKLGPILDWGLNLDKKIDVAGVTDNTEYLFVNDPSIKKIRMFNKIGTKFYTLLSEEYGIGM